MAKRIIVLDRVAPGRFRYALWGDVPAARQPFYADPVKVSAWKDASAPELAALRSGAVVEMVDTTAQSPGTTVPQVQAALQLRWQAFQDEITASNPWVQFGGFWDGTSWTAGGVS